MVSVFRLTRCRKFAILALAGCGLVSARPITTVGGPGVLEIRAAGAHSIRVTLKPADFKADFPDNPVLPTRDYPPASLSIHELSVPLKTEISGLTVDLQPEPLQLTVRGEDGTLIQSLAFGDDGNIGFPLDDRPVLGMGEGGLETPPGADWRKAPVQFDRRCKLDSMIPAWHREAYGSRNPVALLVGTRGWGLYFATPWGQIDLSQPDRGRFLLMKSVDPAGKRQTVGDQGKQLGKGLPPADSFVPGLLDVFIFDARRPAEFMKDVSSVSGPAVLPPKWALGYMQSHRTLEDDAAMVREVDVFREKRLPLDAVIYLGTGFTPRGWNKPQPSFEFNPAVFKRDPAEVISALHERHAKVVLHMVPWDRDRLPTLRGNIPPRPGEMTGPGHIADYWKEHVPLIAAGVDGWWPDEGDWFDLFERLKRHQLYLDGPLSTRPALRPWSLHRNGHLGIARFGGWMWSGDVDSSWKTLETQIAVGLNHSLSVSPYWGSDIGGFLSSPELTGELYARWFQFAAFCPSFRAHGRTWWTRLPWGWGLDTLGPVEDKTPPLVSELNNPAIEPIARRYDELRYRLLSYNYTLAWQARATGMPLMRALWLHYPADPRAVAIGNEYLWGRDLLVAPVFEKGATRRELYLPAGRWYDWWTGQTEAGGRTISRPVDLATMPLYVRAGAILPLDPVRQYTSQESGEPLTIRIYRGSDGDYTLYDDDGTSPAYLQGEFALTRFKWRDAAETLEIERSPAPPGSNLPAPPALRIELFPEGTTKSVPAGTTRITLDFSAE